jgi:apolipoprotein D and lipocalin family protein
METMSSMRAWLILFTIFASSLAMAPASDRLKPGPEAVTNLKLNQYLGQWFEIGTIRQSFQKNCECTTAEYTLSEPNSRFIKVLNTCFNTKDAKWTDASGRAYYDRGLPSLGKLRVGFFLPQLPFLRSDYWVIALDKDYKYSMVSNEEGSTLWILSRTPTLDEGIVDELLSQAKAAGIKTEDFVRTRQDDALCAARPTSLAQSEN